MRGGSDGISNLAKIDPDLRGAVKKIVLKALQNHSNFRA